MKVSHTWLQTYFNDTLPDPEKIGEVFNMNAFEIDDIEKIGDDAILDIDVKPNRSHDCFSHRGIATEIAALFDMPMNATRFEKYGNSVPDAGLVVSVEDSKLCSRYVGRLIEFGEVRPVQSYISSRIKAIGQRSINNIVDICNYVMFDIGQPMHAFDADKVKGPIAVRKAKAGEMITTLDNREVALDESVLVIADDEGPLAIAGIKGGSRAEVDEKTTRIILEAANFNSSVIRKTSQKLGIKTDASKRFENEITPSLAKAGIEYATSLIVENISRDVVVHESVDIYSRKQNPYKVGVSLTEINRLLGTSISETEVSNILDRFGWEYEIVDPLRKILELAPKFVDVPYRLGASVSYDAPNEFDCSSFTAYLFAQAGVAIPRISVDQYVFGNSIDERELQAGDLVFSNTHEETNIKIYYESKEWLRGTKVPEGITHVGLYMGEGKIIHSSRHNECGVVIENLSESSQFKNISGYRRISGLEEKRFVVTAPAVRLDLRLKEDLIEDIGRIYGYDKIPTALPEKTDKPPKINKLFYYSQMIRNILVDLGFDEVQTYAFTDKGEVELENPLASDKKFLRASLEAGIKKSLELNAHNAELLGLDEVKIFEIGNVFTREAEDMKLGLAVKNVKKDKTKEEQKIGEAIAAIYQELDEKDEGDADIQGGFAEISLTKLMEELPLPDDYSHTFEITESGAKYSKISPYPFVLRDMAVWVPAETPAQELEDMIIECSGQLLAKHRLFDTFSKEFDTGEKKTSYAYRLVFQSSEKTLSDEEVNEVMNRMSDKIRTKGWEVR